MKLLIMRIIWDSVKCTQCIVTREIIALYGGDTMNHLLALREGIRNEF